MHKFKIVLTNDSEELNLNFNVKNTDIANKWYQELCKNYELYETNRFSDWGEDYSEIILNLNQQINIINNYDNVIDFKINEILNQKELNRLHKFFENLRGEVCQITPWYAKSPETVKTALIKLNVLIHQLESSLRTKNKHPTLVVTFKNAPRIDLSDDDYKNFTFKWTSGTVYINYCQVGKTILDVFKDRDEITEGIRPQVYYSADFMIKFGPSTNLFIYIIKKLMLKFWIFRNNFKFKNLSLGMIPVAELETKISRTELVKFKKVKTVECIK
jgi:hypothetical protein